MLRELREKALEAKDDQDAPLSIVYSRFRKAASPETVLKLIAFVELVKDNVSCRDPNHLAGKAFGSFIIEPCGRCEYCEVLKACEELGEL